MQQEMNFKSLISSLNVSELQSLVLQLSENDRLLSDRIVNVLRSLLPDLKNRNILQDSKEILTQAHRIFHFYKECCCKYPMEEVGDSYDDFLLSLQSLFADKITTQSVLIIQGITELFAENLNKIMGECEEGLPWQSVAEQLGKYWFQVAFCESLRESDCRSLFSCLSASLSLFKNYGLDDPFYPSIQILQKRCVI